jgi:hypothetical protein
VDATVKCGDRRTAGRPTTGTLTQFGEQILERLHGQRLFHAVAGEVTAV